MRRFMQTLLAFGLAWVSLVGPAAAAPARLALAANLDTIADRVVGQPDFTHNDINHGGLSAASLWGPSGVALDRLGNLYVADAQNNRVLEYDAPLTSDAAANRVFGQPNFISNTVNTGGLSAKSLNLPSGVAVDAQGNLYVADFFNNRVLEYEAPLTSGAAAARVFGQPDFTHNTPNNGGISATSLYLPSGAAVDAQGNLYVADGMSRVLEYNAPLATHAAAARVFGQPDFTQGLINNGGVSATSLSVPTGVALDAHGNLYVGDPLNNRVLEYDQPVPYGVPGLTALSPSAVAAGSAALTLTITGAGFVAGSSVRWFGSDRPTTFVDSTRLSASISAADVAAGGSAAVTVFTPAPGGGTSTLINLAVYTRAGQDARADTEQGQPNFMDNAFNNPLLPIANGLNSPSGVAVDATSGRLFVADSNDNRVLSWPNARDQANGQAPDLVLGQPDFNSTQANNGGLSATSLWFPYGLALDGQGDLYVADLINSRVLEYDAPLSSHMAAGRVFGQGGSFTTGVANDGGVSANSLNGPLGLALDRQGNLYVADDLNNRVLEYDTPLSSDTSADKVFGQPDFNSTQANNGGLSANSLFGPTSAAVEANGAQGGLYVVDKFNNRVLEYDNPLANNHTADRVLGQPSFITNTANTGGVSANSLNAPFGVALDGQGNLYVADTNNNRVLEYDSAQTTDGTADRVLGQPSFITNTANNDGVSANGLNSPSGVALDGQGNLYVGDQFNNRVLEYDRPLPLLAVFLPLMAR